MKKLIVSLVLTMGIATSASAHHMAANPDAGASIPDWSPHLEMVF